MLNNTSIIIPVVREDRAKCAIEAAHNNCPGAEIIFKRDTERIGCPKMVQLLTERTTRDWVCFLGDDTEIQPGALEAALEKASELPDGWGVVGLSTEKSVQQAHWVAHKNMLELLPDAAFFSPAYQHNFCDNELRDIAEEHGRWAWSENAHVKHNHPVTGGVIDAHHTFANQTYVDDRTTYFQRKRDRFGNKIAIGFPLVDETVPVQFFTSFACMDKPSQYTLLVPQFPHGPWKASIADARNSLVEQALYDGARHLLMLDTDQVYPADTLTKLISHNVGICGVRVHRRWMPFDPIFLRGDIGRYEPVTEDEMYSGDLIEIDATGTGCLLFNMGIFDKLTPQWFEFGKATDGKPVGEDINFCSKARNAGVRIFVDTSIEVGHLITMEINKSLHQMCKHLTAKVPGM